MKRCAAVFVFVAVSSVISASGSEQNDEEQDCADWISPTTDDETLDAVCEGGTGCVASNGLITTYFVRVGDTWFAAHVVLQHMWF